LAIAVTIDRLWVDCQWFVVFQVRDDRCRAIGVLEIAVASRFVPVLPSRVRADQSVAIEVLEALRPLGVQAAIDALDDRQNQTADGEPAEAGKLESELVGVDVFFEASVEQM
jgi:hypothetical protein